MGAGNSHFAHYLVAEKIFIRLYPIDGRNLIKVKFCSARRRPMYMLGTELVISEGIIDGTELGKNDGDKVATAVNASDGTKLYIFLQFYLIVTCKRWS